MELEQELRKIEEIEYSSKSDPFTEYKNTFIQRIPRYAVKQIGKSTWRTKKKSLSDIPVKAHLNGQYYIAVLSKWYPEYSILDIDNTTLEEPERIRDKLGLDPANSMLFSSESPDSYHILIRPSYDNKPPTTRLLQNIFKLFGKQNNIEIYPQANKTIRLPFGYGQDCLDIEYINSEDWKDKLYWFLKLDDFDLSDIPYHQRELDLTYKDPKIPNVFKEGEYLLKNGLQTKSSRYDAQWKMLYNLLRRNIPVSQAKIMVWHVIKNKHNSFSKDIITNPGKCKKEIDRQAAWIYDNCEHCYIYPDETHNGYNGYITKSDIPKIVRISKANLPRMRFSYNLVRYCYPRRDRDIINIHSDKLIEWSSTENYLKYLDELIKSEIVKRGNKYVKGGFSKSINIDWKFRNWNEAILDDGRSPNSFEDTIKLSYKPEEFRELLIKAGSSREVAIVKTSRLFKP